MKKIALSCIVLLSAALLFAVPASADSFLLPIISVSPASYDFGPVPVYAIASADFLVTNSGDVPLVVSAVKTKAPFMDNATSFTVPGHSSRRITIYFAPTALGSYTGVCTILSNAANLPTYNIGLAGEGVD